VPAFCKNISDTSLLQVAKNLKDLEYLGIADSLISDGVAQEIINSCRFLKYLSTFSCTELNRTKDFILTHYWNENAYAKLTFWDAVKHGKMINWDQIWVPPRRKTIFNNDSDYVQLLC